MKEFITKNFLGILLIIFTVYIYFDISGKNATGNQGPDTIRVIEYIQQPPVYIPQYVPVVTHSQPVTNIPPNYIPSSEYKELKEQFEKLVREHLQTNIYKDSITLKDTAGNKVGVVNLEDAISENKFKTRNPSYQLNFPKEVITIREPYKPRNQLFIGGGPLGNENTFFSGAKAGFYLKDKKDRLYGASVYSIKNQPITYSLEAYFKIRLGKK